LPDGLLGDPGARFFEKEWFRKVTSEFCGHGGMHFQTVFQEIQAFSIIMTDLRQEGSDRLRVVPERCHDSLVLGLCRLRMLDAWKITFQRRQIALTERKAVRLLFESSARKK
jgi:hypothetical protein